MSGGRWRVAVAGAAGSCLLGLAPAAVAAAATSTTSTTTAVSPASTARVSIVDFGFSPATITVAADTTVTWVNTGSSIHSVTSDTGAFDSSPSCPTGPCLDPGSSYSHRFAAAARFSYHCRVHATMTGTIVVTATPASTTSTTAATPTTGAPGNPPVSAGATPAPSADASPASSDPQLAFTGAPAEELWLTLGALLTITLGLALRPRRRPFPVPVPVRNDRPDPT